MAADSHMGLQTADGLPAFRPSAAPSSPIATPARASSRLTFPTSVRIEWIILGIFLLSTAIRIALACFGKAIDVMPDELRYLGTARSLFTDGTLTLRGEDSDFQKILFSLLLFPITLTPDTRLQITIASITCAVVASSAIFPIALIARKVFSNDKHAILFTLACSTFPDICYSMTLMSESLYLPLALWVILLLWNILSNDVSHPLAVSLAAGLVCYGAYLCKEVALCFVIAYLALQTIAAFHDEGGNRRQSLLQVLLFIIGFAVPFIVMKLTLFSGMGNSYDQTSLDALGDPYAWLYGLYGLGINGTHLLLGFAFFPIVFTLLFLRRFPHCNKMLAKLSLTALAVCFLVILYTITIREDIGNESVRQHLRYCSVFMIPLAACFMSLFISDEELSVRSSFMHGVPLAAITGCFCMGIIAFYGRVDLSQGFDQCLLHFYDSLSKIRMDLVPHGVDQTVLIGEGNPTMAFDVIQWATQFTIIAIVLILSAMLLSKNRKAGAGLFCCLMCFLFIANSVSVTGYNFRTYGMDEESISAACEANEYLKTHDDGSVLIVFDDENTDANNLMDTYIQDYGNRYAYVSQWTFEECIDDKGILDKKRLAEMAFDGRMPSIGLILTNDQQFLDFKQSSAKRIGLQHEGPFIIHRLDPDKPFGVITNSAQ